MPPSERAVVLSPSVGISKRFFLTFAILLSFTALSVAQSGLVAAYSFNEGSGSSVHDLSGNNVTGTIVGATWTTQGKYGSGLSFNGTSSYVDLGNPAALQLTGSMTLEAWVKAAADPSNDGQIIAKSDTASGWQLKTSRDTGAQAFGMAVTNSSGSRVQRYNAAGRSLNTWYHVAGVYNSASSTLNIYVNGVLDNGALRGTVPTSILNSLANVNIGRRSGGYYFNGIIDEVRIYSRALSVAEIQSDMNTPLGNGGNTTGDTQPPTAPASLTASTAGASTINLAWGSSTDNVGVTGYLVERCQGSGCTNFMQISTPSSNSFSDTGRASATSYSYRVRATDAAGNLSSYSNTASATTDSSGTADTQAPSAPSNLAASWNGSAMQLTWNASSDNVGVSSYRVERCQGPGCTNFTEITSQAGAITRPLAASSSNPNYFVDSSGSPVALNGSHTWNDFQDWGTNGSPQALDFNAYVNFLSAHGQNFTLLWRIELAKFCGMPTTASNPPDFTVSSQPWQRTGPGNASDGKLKFDLTKFDQSYFDRLRARVMALKSAGIYVGVYLFTGEWLNVYRCSSDGYPLTGSNNINGVDDGYSGSGQSGMGSMTMNAANPVTGAQDAYVEKVIDTLNDLPNVLWIISEEATPNTMWWQNHQISHIRSYESGKAWQHPIGFGVMTDFNDTTLTNSNADWISPYVRVSPTSSCGSGTPRCKVNINDSDHSNYGMWNASDQANRGYAWSNFMSGNQVAFMDPYLVSYSRENRNLCTAPANGICSTPDSRWNNFRDNLGYITRYAHRLNLITTTPHGSLSSTSNCLAQPSSTGAVYLVYAPNGGTFTVDLSAMSSSRSLNVEWFNPATGATITANPVAAGGTRSFTPPFSGDALLYLADSAVQSNATSNATTFTDSSVVSGQTYNYRVRASDAAGNQSAYSNTVTATAAPPGSSDTQAPTAPSSAVATATSTTSVGLSWTAATDNVGVTGYRIERCQGIGCNNFAQVGTSTGTSYSDAGLTSGTSYGYRVRATDAAANLGPYSNVATATTPSSSSGLIAAFNFSEGSGATANDVSGNGNNGTIQGATWTASGKYGSALSFNGTNSYVDLGNPAALQLNGSMTLEAWIKAAANPPDDGQIIAKSNSAGGWQLKTSPDTGSQTFGAKVSGSSAAQRYSKTIRSLTTWYHLASVYNATSGALDIYVNGVLDSGTLKGTIPASQVQQAVNVNIGRRADGYYFNGVIDEVRVYNRALSQAEIQSDMNTPIGGGGVSDTQAPTAPSSLTATAASSSQINLLWTGSTDNVGVTNYLIERCQGASCTGFAQIATATGTTYNNTGLASATSYSYRVRATDAAGNLSSYSNVATAVTGSTAVGPTITQQPANATVTAGQTATFTVTATGTAPLSYQWQKGTTNISGATSSSYTTPATTTADSGTQFRVIVTNSVGNATSNSATLTVNPASAANVLTYHNDNARTGQNLSETTLTPNNVNSAQFGKIANYAMDGRVDAQPLYASSVAVPSNGTHNLLIVATEHASVYALDADTGTQIWKKSMLASGESASDDRGCSQVSPEIGVTSTPVIDRSRGPNGTIFVVAMSKNGSTYHHRLHALDLATGADLLTPKEIQGSYPGTGDGSNGTNVIFDPKQYKERAGLLLMNGVIHTSWASHCDFTPYTGWLMSYNADTLAQTSVLNVTPNGSMGAIWMAGAGLAADNSGNYYFLDANGDFGTSLNSSGFPANGNFGNAFIKVSTTGGTLAVADYFEMFNGVSESAADTDLGSGGAMVLPDLTDSTGAVKHLAVGVGKDAHMYVVNRDNMGKFNSSTNNIYQDISGALAGGVFAMPAYFNGKVYYGAVSDSVKAFNVTNARFATSASAHTTNSFGYPGATPSVSANGTSNGIVWAVENGNTAVLHAYDASTLNELYNSNQAANSRDHFGAGNKYITPTIVNGKAFVGTTNSVAVFGLLP